MTTSQRRRLKRLLDRLEAAAEDMAFKGGKDPDTWDWIDEEIGAARKALVEFIEGLAAAGTQAAK